MGEIIAFSSKARPAAAAPPLVGGAQILFFLGVRYVRQEDAADAAKESAAAKDAATKAPSGRGDQRRPRVTRPRHDRLTR
ncbi:MAG TPA: hypothetical protein VIF40_17320 [Methylosinus sp.]|jgi:hypothetical protein|uniref:hypothetical protein n=1 Tax=Methylosinus sp. TaxID=427 RepID=UPI002F95F315